MSLRNILLGMMRRPHSGYDVKKEFDSSLRNFWRAELSQIYPTLAKLERDGLLTSDKVESEQGPQRVVYSRTDAGRQALRNWLEEPIVATERVGFLAQTYFLGQLEDNDAAIRFFTELRAYFARRLEKLSAREAEWAASDPRYPDELPDYDFFPQLTLDCGLHRIRATLDWCDKSLARLEARAQRRAS
ncbi:MAG: PadR family transcriptional regulator [Woeseiaceae bacterium]|nr:PadR family transcriptional regulator [Woeseiaceae bacterium]